MHNNEGASQNHEYQEYLRSPRWRDKRAAVMRRAKGRCEYCRDRRARHVHHVTYARIFREPLRDLAALCVRCHKKAHSGGFSGRPNKHPSRRHKTRRHHCGCGEHFPSEEELRRHAREHKRKKRKRVPWSRMPSSMFMREVVRRKKQEP